MAEIVHAHGVDLDVGNLATPAFVVLETALKRNLAILEQVRNRTGANVLLALKGFAMHHVFPLLRETLQGTCASSLHEARLGREKFGGHVHAFAAAYPPADFPEILRLCDHVIFNSFRQWERYRPLVERTNGRVHAGIRLNPEHSETATALYDPCAPGSRLGVTVAEFRPALLEGISGFHIHTLCEKNSDAFARTLAVTEQKFGQWFKRVKWINLGGGQLITSPDYDLDLLCDTLTGLHERYGLEMFLEPGEAVALNAGILVAEVLDVVRNRGVEIAVLDASAATHMPDVLEMPYRPNLVGAGMPGEHSHTYRLAGMSCLAGDVIGDYSFPHPLEPGCRLVFLDMAHYTMVKTTTFNGIRLPDIVLAHEDGRLSVVRSFTYEDFASRLS